MQVLTASGKSAIDKVASKDPTRPVLTGVHLTLDEEQPDKTVVTGWLAATDSYKLGIVPVSFDKAEKPVAGIYPAEAFKKALASTSGLMLFTPDTKKELGGVKVFTKDGDVEYKRIDGQFPNWNLLMPEEGTLVGPDFKLSFNAKLLYELAQGLGSEHVILEPMQAPDGDGPNMLRPIRVRAGVGDRNGRTADDGPLGILMPIRVGG